MAARYITARCEAAPDVAFKLRVDLTSRQYQRLAAGLEYTSEALRTLYREWLTLHDDPAATDEAKAAMDAQIVAQVAADQEEWYALLVHVYSGWKYALDTTLAIKVDMSSVEAVKATLANEDLDYLLLAWLVKAPAMAMDIELTAMADDAKKSFGRASS